MLASSHDLFRRVQSDLRSLITTILAAIVLYAFGLLDELARRVVAAMLSEQLETRVRVEALSIWALAGRVDFDGASVENWRDLGFGCVGSGKKSSSGRRRGTPKTAAAEKNTASSPTSSEAEPPGTPKSHHPYRDAVEISRASVQLDVARALTKRVVAIQSMRVRRVRVVLVRRADGTLNVEMFSRKKRAAEKDAGASSFSEDDDEDDDDDQGTCRAFGEADRERRSAADGEEDDDNTTRGGGGGAKRRTAAADEASHDAGGAAGDDEWVDLGGTHDPPSAAPVGVEATTTSPVASALGPKLWSLVAIAKAEAEARVRELRSTGDAERTVLEDAALYALDAAETARAEASIASEKAKRWARDKLHESVGDAVDALFANLEQQQQHGPPAADASTKPGPPSSPGVAVDNDHNGPSSTTKKGGPFPAAASSGSSAEPPQHEPRRRRPSQGGGAYDKDATTTTKRPPKWRVIFEADATLTVGEVRVEVVDAATRSPLVDPPLVFGARVLRDLPNTAEDDPPARVLLQVCSVLAKSCVEELVEERPADAARLVKAVAKLLATDTRRRAAESVAHVAKKWGVDEWRDAAKAVLLGSPNSSSGSGKSPSSANHHHHHRALPSSSASTRGSSSSSEEASGAAARGAPAPASRAPLAAPQRRGLSPVPSDDSSAPLSAATSTASFSAMSAADLRDRGVSF